ncbi:hypothetical protein ANCDUO_26653 [Ancylostoma duodenale]|uniref:Reticulon-like protein n=1 Tax=Ancylostoma duodenale TaxID=51022 RepID=A0A0C2F8X3_9BILA|nr:hypothetical protein ANCDUO_26653 [Ancylostoma duodenale]
MLRSICSSNESLMTSPYFLTLCNGTAKKLFALILWALTYIAYWFSGFALIVLGVLAVFSVPKVYEMYQEPIDAQLAVISEHIKNATKMAEEKLPFLTKAQTEVEKKEQ